MSRRGVWEQVHQRFNPMKPAEVASWRASRPSSPASAIGEALDLPFGTPHVLFTGTIGTGKTTELLRIADLRSAKEFTVFLPLDKHFDEVVQDPAALQNVSAWEVIFLAALALLRSAEERLGFNCPDAHLRDLGRAWTALARSSKAVEAVPEVDVAKLAKAMVLVASSAAPLVAGPPGALVGAGLATLGAVAEAGRWNIPFGLGRKTENVLVDQDPDVQSLLQCVNVIVGLVQQRAGQVLLILDGLDRVEERAAELFLDSQIIGQLACPLVLCGPFALRRDGVIANVRGFDRVPPLVNVEVLSRDDPSRPGPGISFFEHLFAQRTADFGAPDLLAKELLDRLAYYSGGRARDFIQFIRRLSELAYLADVPTATEALVDRVIDEFRRVKETGLHRGHIRVLETIANDYPEHRLIEDELAYKLLTTAALLPYPDGSEWYYPHPLLTIRFLHVSPVGSSK